MINKGILGYGLFFLIVSCGGVRKSQEIDIKKNRVFTSTALEVQTKVDTVNFKNLMLHYAPSQKMSVSTFKENFYQSYNGASNIFILKSNASEVGYLDFNMGLASALKIPKNSPFGLVIGQSKNALFYYHGSDRGKSFSTYTFSDSATKKYSIKDFTVLRVNGLQDDRKLLACGVYTLNNKPKLGFYIIDLNRGEVIETLFEEKLKQSPNGEPSIYGGSFYNYNDDIFFAFDKKDGIYHFNTTGTFVQKLKTPDSYNFPNEEGGSSSGNRITDFLCTNMFVHHKTLYVLLNVVNKKGSSLLFDTYNLDKGIYTKSWPLSLSLDTKRYEVVDKITFQKNGIINMMFPDKKNENIYLHQQFRIVPHVE